MCPLPHKQQALTEPLAQGSLSHSHFSESSKHAYSVPYQWSFAFYYYKTFVLEKKSSKKRDLSWKHHSQTREMFLNIPKATSLCWRITGLPATWVSLCRASWIIKSQINTGHSVPYSLACWELGSQRWYQTPAPTSPEQTLLIGQCVLPTVSHSSLGPGFTTAWFSVCKGKSWLQTLPSFIPC